MTVSRTHLPLGGYLALAAFLVALVAGLSWFNSTAQASTNDNVLVQAVIAEKTTVHQPISTTTNGITLRRMENSFIVTLAFQDGRKPPQTMDQQVNARFFETIAVNSPVRVTMDPATARIVDITPGLLPDPARFATTFALGFLFLALGLAAAIWRKRTFETPDV